MGAIKFKSNTRELRAECERVRRSLEAARAPFEKLWLELRKNIEPDLGKALLGENEAEAAGERDDSSIITSEPRIYLNRLAAGLQSGITNPARQWFRFASRDKKAGKSARVRAWLDDATEAVASVLQNSNVYTSLELMYSHLGLFGTACGILSMRDGLLHLRVIDEGAYWLAQNFKGRVDVCVVRHQMSVAQIREEFGDGAFEDFGGAEARSKDGERTRTVWQLICPRERVRVGVPDIARERPFLSVYWLGGGGDGAVNDGVLGIRSYGVNPIVAPRWKASASVYGTGPGKWALPEVKGLHALELAGLRLVSAEVDPAMNAPESMRGKRITTGPGGLNYVPDGVSLGGGRMLHRTLEPNAAAFQAKEGQSTKNSGRIKMIFMADLFAMMMNISVGKRQMTATEVQELAAEKVMLLGPVLTRLDSDGLNPLLDGVWQMVFEAGLEAFPQLWEVPPQLRGVDVVAEYISALHIEQKRVSRLAGMSQLMEFSGGLAQFNPEVLDNIDFDKAVEICADVLFEHGVVRDAKDVAALRQGRAQAQQQMQQQQQMLAAAGAAKDAAAAQRSQAQAAELGTGD